MDEPTVDECEFCGMQGPTLRTYPEGTFHEDCCPNYAAYTVIRDAIHALPVGLTEVLEQLLKDDIDTKIESDYEDYACRACGTKNRVLKGTDPGEYRCTKCVSWL